MSLAPGTRLGPYEIVSSLGAGGMGEVYRAHDDRLGRAVAIKVLAERLADDPEFRSRLDREARAASALSHASICTVFDVGEEDGRPYIVMECLEGEPLDARLQRGPLDLDEQEQLSAQLTDALAAAHARHIVHRDIKPANIFLQSDGPAKILDFGIAKQANLLNGSITAETAATLAPSDVTAPGTTLGTFSYMSPEQARGDEVDGRTDLFSLGAVLYESATGTSPFARSTTGRTLEAVLSEHPAPATSLRSDLPPEIERIYDKLLEKDRDLRYQSATDLRADLARLRRDTGQTSAATSAGRAEAAPEVARRSRWAVLTVAGIGAIAIVGAAAYFILGERTPEVAPPSEWIQLTDFTDSVVAPAFSPNGDLLTYLRGPSTFVGEADLYVQRLPDGEPVRLSDDGRPRMDPRFSPDGDRIAYSVGLFSTEVVPVLGGEPTPLLPNSSALSWISDDEVMFSENRGGLHLAITVANESRAEQRDVYVPENSVDGMAHRAYLSPDRQHVLIAEMDGGWAPCRVVPFDGSTRGSRVGPPGVGCTSGAWSPDGSWVYLTVETDGRPRIWRQHFPDGEPEQITSGPTAESGIAFAPDGESFVTSVGLSRTLLYVNQGDGEKLVLAEGDAAWPQTSADGATVYYVSYRAGGVAEIWSWDDAAGRAEAVLPGFPVRNTARPFHVSDDETQIAISAVDGQSRGAVWLAPLDRSTPPRSLTDSLGDVSASEVFTTDAGVYFAVTTEDGSYVHRAADDTVERVFDRPVIGLRDVSNNGRWLILRMADGGAARQPAGDTGPQSSASGTAIYLLDTEGTELQLLCGGCYGAEWGPGESHLYFDAGPLWVAASIPAGRIVPNLGPEGLTQELVMERDDLQPIVQGGGGIFDTQFSPSSDPPIYGVVRTEVRRNLYRVPLR